MKRHESVVWLPPRSIGERAFASEPSLLALVHTPEGPRYSRLSLDAMPAVRGVRLVFDARDVTLLRVALPPLSGARLRQAVPNAVEDQLLQDAGSCAFALGPREGDGKRLVAVIDRAWFEFVVGAFRRRAMRVLSAMPAQLAAPWRDGEVSLVCIGDGVAVRTGPGEGLGWTAGLDDDAREHALVSLLGTVLAPPAPAGALAGAAIPSSSDAAVPAAAAAEDESQSGDLLSAETDVGGPAADDAGGRLHAGTVRLLAEDDAWRGPMVAAARRLRLKARASSLPLQPHGPIDLMSAASRAGIGQRLADVDWRAWRAPAWLAAGSLAVFLLGLNLHWGKLAAEKADLRASLETRYRQTFPQDRVVVDPVLQMERNVAKMRAGAGQSGPDDFLPLLTRFAEALGPQAANALTGLEYRDGRLRVTFEPSLVAARSVRENMTAACHRLGLALRFETGREQSAVVGLL